MVFRKRRHRSRGVKKRVRRGGFIITVPLLIAGAIAAAKAAAAGAAMAAGGVAANSKQWYELPLHTLPHNNVQKLNI